MAVRIEPNKAAWFKRIGYEPHSGQDAYHASSSRFKIPSCGRRFGKSTMVAREEEPRLLLPDRRTWIVGPQYDLAEKEFRVIWNDMMVKLELARDKRIKRAYNLRTGEMFIEFPWGTRIECKSAAQPDRLVGEALHHVIMSEAAKHVVDTWERYIRAALSDYHGTADFPSTPEGFNWYYNLWRLGQHPDHADYASWKFPSWFNNFLFPGGFDDPEIQMLLRTTGEEWFKQEYGADFASFVGKIYEEFDETKHVQRVEYLPGLPNYMTIDWGFSAPQAILEFQVTPSGDVRVWREHYKRGLTQSEHMQELKKRDDPPDYHVDFIFGDAADPEALEEWRQHNPWSAPVIGDPESKTNWRQGIDLVKQHLRLNHDGHSYDDYERPITKPKYFVDHDCPEHIREMSNYRVKDNFESGRENSTAGVARKIDDHTCDAIRYGLMHVVELGYNTNTDAREFLVAPDRPPVVHVARAHELDYDPGYGMGNEYSTITQNMRF